MSTRHTIRKAPTGRGTVEVELTPAKAIRAFCTECLGWETHPDDCEAVHCPLYPFRGKTTLAWGRQRTEAQRAADAARAEALRNAEKPYQSPQDRVSPPDVTTEPFRPENANLPPFHGDRPR